MFQFKIKRTPPIGFRIVNVLYLKSFIDKCSATLVESKNYLCIKENTSQTVWCVLPRHADVIVRKD